MKSLKYFCIVLFLICPFIFSRPSFAESVIIVTGEWEPYSTKNLNSYGLCPEIVTEAMTEIGMNVKYHFFPWQRCEHSVLKGKVWAALPYIKSAEREKNYTFSDSIAYSRGVFFYYKDKLDGFDWKILEDLKPFKIGGVLGYENHEKYKKKGLNVEYVSDETLNFRKLKAGRIDLVPMDEIVGLEIIRSQFPEDVNNFKSLPTPETEYSLHLIIDKNNSDSLNLLEQFNNALKRIKEKDIYSTILKKYNLKK